MSEQINDNESGEQESVKLKEISPYKSYTVGIPAKGSSNGGQNPQFRKQVVMHGSELKKAGIINLVHFTENKRAMFAPNQTYVIYEIDDTQDGLLKFWGTFTAQIPPEPKPKRQSPQGLSSNGNFAPQPPTPQEMTHRNYPLNAPPTPNAIDHSTRSANAMRESYDKMLADKQAQIDYNNAVRDREIASLKESHRQEIDRIIDTKQSEILTLENLFAKTEEKYEKQTGETYILQNKIHELTGRLAELESKLANQAEEHAKRYKFLEAEYKTREELFGQEIRLKQQQAGLSDGGGTMAGVLDIVKTFAPLVQTWMANNASNNTPPAQVATATAQGAPPPRPIRTPLPALPSQQQPQQAAPQQQQQEVQSA